MVAAMRHRGPDGEGVWVSSSGRCALGHCRLAILDLTEAASQPMLTPDRRFAISYNGECYNFKDLRRQMTGAGERFASSGDTEVLLRWLARENVEALSRVNGMFALAFWDDVEQRLVLARDRFGQKPLYWALVDGHCVFASEIRAMLASKLFEGRADAEGIASYLALGAVQGPRSILSGASLLPRATSLVVARDQSPVSRTFWEPPRDKRRLASAELRELLLEAVARHLISDVPVGLFLSGGIDSSAIAAAAAAGRGAGAIRSLTVVFPDQPGQSEADFARRMARHAGTDHAEIPVTGRDMLGLLDGALAALDQPSIDGVNTYIVSEAARRAGLTVAISGLGGDELFGGYDKFRRGAYVLARLLRTWPARPVVRGLLRCGDPYDRRTAKLGDWLDAPAGLVSAYLVRRRLFASRQMGRLAPGLSPAGWSGGVGEDRLGELDRMIRGRPFADAIGLMEADVYMGQTLLRDSDVMGMAHSLEIRVPFLDAELSENVLRMEPEVRTPNRVPKHRLVEALGERIPRGIWQRPKRGFTLPLADWLQGPLRDRMVEDVADLAAAGGPFAGSEFDLLLDRFFARPAATGWSRPWALFVLGSYLKRHRLAL
jgi:asparagine synthase (glutamine-hydrolysing)